MAKYQNKYRIESNRWEFWNYTAPGAYFITICTINREKSFGVIQKGQMHLSQTGDTVKKHIQSLWQYHKRLVLDEWVIMPNHIHLIITLGDIDFDNGEIIHELSLNTMSGRPVERIHEFSLQAVRNINEYAERYMMPISLLDDITEEDIKAYRKLRRQMLIPIILGKLKMQISKEMNILNETPERKNWQADYHDHIIRNETSYLNIKQYIINNPDNWNEDMFFN